MEQIQGGTSRAAAAASLAIVILCGLPGAALAQGRVARAHRPYRKAEVRLPAPPSTLPPLIGSPVPQADGYAPQTADRIGLLSLLFARRFTDLDHSFEAYQTAFEKDFRKEQQPEDAVDAFGIDDPRLDPLLDEWVKVSPRSFGAWAARGAHRSAQAWVSRGSGSAVETPDGALRSYDDLRRQAAQDLGKSLELRPRLIAAYRLLVGDSPDDRARSESLLAASIKACPDCYRVRRAHLQTLFPQWSGSLEEMKAFVDGVAARTSPKLRFFPGLIPWFEANSMRDGPEALELYEKALSYGEHWEFLQDRGRSRAAARDIAGAKKDFDRALELRPQIPNLLMSRANLLGPESPVAAAADLIQAIRIDPRLGGASLVSRVLDELMERSQLTLSAGGIDEAIAGLRIACDLHPGGAAGPSAPLSAAASREIEACPDTESGTRTVGIRLAYANQLDAVEELWARYIARHPGDPRGLRFRGAARLAKGDVPGFEADEAAARALGAKTTAR